MKNRFCTVQEAVAEVKKGNMLIVLDSPRRENEADLYIAADTATPRAITTMIQHGGGIVCTALTEEAARRLDISPMVPPAENTEKTRVNFTVSVNARRGISTGVSAYDRAKTIRILAHKHSCASDLVKPGHVLGLVARSGGTLERQGHTEASVDLARLAGRAPAGVLCEIVGRNGRMAKRDEITRLSQTLGVKMITIASLVRYLRKHPLPRVPRLPAVSRISSSTLPTAFGTFMVVAYKSPDEREHAALLFERPKKKNALVRVHSQCLTGDTLFSLRCDCGEQLKESMRRIRKEKSGVVIYASQEGRGVGLANKIRAYALQDKGLDTVEANHALGFSADPRTYEVVADILRDLGIKKVRLLTNNPEKEKQLVHFGIQVRRVPLEIPPNGTNNTYLKAKKRKLKHRLTLV